jgi:ribosomal protein S18 acetylase RimI-like enzyme
MPIEIRILRNGDDSVLANVAPDVFDDPIDVHAAAEFLSDPRHHLAVAIDNGLVVGFASAVLYVHPDKPRPELWINEVGVSPTHHRRGIGRTLLDVLLDVGRNAGCAEAWVLTDRSNPAAMHLYASVGGQEAPGNQVMFTFFLDGEHHNGVEDSCDSRRRGDQPGFFSRRMS